MKRMSNMMCDRTSTIGFSSAVARVDQKIRSRAEQCHILADASKFGRTALARHGFVQEMDSLITYDRIPDRVLAASGEWGRTFDSHRYYGGPTRAHQFFKQSHQQSQTRGQE